MMFELFWKMCTSRAFKRMFNLIQEGCVSMWDTRLRLQRTIRIVAESCSAKDLWVTSFIPLHNINKLALTLTSKEIGKKKYIIICLCKKLLHVLVTYSKILFMYSIKININWHLQLIKMMKKFGYCMWTVNCRANTA